MSRLPVKTAFLLTTALTATALIASSSGAVSTADDVSDLLDPGLIAAGVCGRSDRHATAFKPMQLALVSPAEGVAADPAGPRSGTASAR